VRFGVTAIAALAALLSASDVVRAQAPPQPPPGFVSSYEIVQTLRSAGFDPLAPPLREGTVYVARATDYRGILMRVVLDARTGAIRDANRIVPGPGNYDGPYGGAYGETYGSEPYGAGPYGPAPSGPEFDGSGPYGRVGMMPPPDAPPRESNNSIKPTAPNVARPATGVTVPPLPRPRPPQLASRQPADAAKPTALIDSKAEMRTKPDAAPTANAPAAGTAPPAPAPAKPSEAPATLTINN
jgi:hypothetical protein